MVGTPSWVSCSPSEEGSQVRRCVLRVIGCPPLTCTRAGRPQDASPAGSVGRRRGAACSTTQARVGGGRVLAFYLLNNLRRVDAPARRAARRGARARTPRLRAAPRQATRARASEASAMAKSRNCPRHRRDDRAALGAPLLGRRTRARTRTGPTPPARQGAQKQSQGRDKSRKTLSHDDFMTK